MNKKELVAKLMEQTDLEKKQAEAAISALIDIVIEAVSNEEKIQLIGFGTFESRARKERVVTNPQTKEKFTTPATTVPAFKAGAAFKKSVVEAVEARKAAAAASAPAKKKKK